MCRDVDGNIGYQCVEEATTITHSGGRATRVQSVFLCLNLYVGLGLLSMPYAFKLGGWASIAALIPLILLFCLSAHLLTASLDAVSNEVAPTYPNLGYAAFGRVGRSFVMVMAIMELFGSCVIIVLVMWQQIGEILPGHYPILAISMGFLVPPLLLDGLQGLSAIATLGFISSIMVVVIVAALPFTTYNNKEEDDKAVTHNLFNYPGILTSVGIFAVSCSAHSALPAVRRTMEKQELFSSTLKSTFFTMLLLYLIVACAGYWQWGDGTRPLLTANLARSGVPAVVSQCISGMILISCSGKYPAIIAVLQEMMFHSNDRYMSVFFKLLIALGSLLSAYFGRHMLATVISLTGGIASLQCSLTFPVGCYARLHWESLSTVKKSYLCLVLIVGLGLAVTVTVVNIQILLK